MVATRQAGGPYGGKDALNFSWRGPAIQTQLDAALEAAMRETEVAAVVIAKRLARVDTGEMRDGLGGEVTVRGVGRRLTLVLYGEADHTLFNELGTAHMSAQPMLRPAIDAEGPRLTGRLKARARGIR